MTGKGGSYGEATLESDGGPGRSRTRLIMCLRARFPLTLRGLLFYLLFKPGDFVMMRRMMRTLKQPAEA